MDLRHFLKINYAFCSLINGPDTSGRDIKQIEMYKTPPLPHFMFSVIIIATTMIYITNNVFNSSLN